MNLVVLLFSLALPEAVPAILAESQPVVLADTARPRTQARPAQTDRDRRTQPDRDRKPSREPEVRRPPSSDRGKAQPTGDPQLKRRKPPSLNSPRRP